MESYATTIQRGYGLRLQTNWVDRLRVFFNSTLFYITQTILAFVFVLFGIEPIGVVFFVGLLAVILLVCEDIMPTLLPFLLLCTFATNCYNSFNLFIGYAIYAPIVVLCAIYHFVFYRTKISSGYSFLGIGAVSLAVCLGGIGDFDLEEYMSGAYYLFGLGLGMMVAYLIMRSKYFMYRSYDFKKKFCFVMLLVGALCVSMVIVGYSRVEWKLGFSLELELGRETLEWHVLKARSYHYGVLPGFSRNNICTMLMFAMPFPLFMAREKGKDWMAIFTPLMYAAITVSTSRGGLLLGGVEFVACCLYWIFEGKNRWARFGICAAAGVTVLIIFGGMILEVFETRIIKGDQSSDYRMKMIKQAFENFFERPVFGAGILDDDIAYGEFNKKGTMAWYHMMIPQIIGSMGLLGVVAYCYQFIGRTRLALRDKTSWSLCLGLSYFGILLMSQVNPGEFCPLPFELFTVLLFILQEYRLEKPKFALWQRKF